MQARIYIPTKTTTQSGEAAKKWVLEYVLEPGARIVDNVMGWTSSTDMNQELLMKFESKEQAEDYAKRNNIAYEVIEPTARKLTKKSYADNFK
jgi:hypothetical protein